MKKVHGSQPSLNLQKTRERIFLEFSKACKLTRSKVNFEDYLINDQMLTQFILDPTSLNLEKRVHMNDPALNELLRISRDYCYAINSLRVSEYKKKEKWKQDKENINTFKTSLHYKIWMIEMYYKRDK